MFIPTDDWQIGIPYNTPNSRYRRRWDNYFKGTLDESKDSFNPNPLSTGWIKHRYRNISDPSGFYLSRDSDNTNNSLISSRSLAIIPYQLSATHLVGRKLFHVPTAPGSNYG
jgi:hypothetical protein